MNNLGNSFLSLLKLGWQNTLRWRWRLLTMSTLIGLCVALYLLYSGLIADLTAQGEARIQPLETPYFDILVLLQEDQLFLPMEQLPVPRGRRIVAFGEGAFSLKMASDYGNLHLLGLQPQSDYYQVETEDLQGRLPEAMGEVALPWSWAEENGIHLNDRLTFVYTKELPGVTWDGLVVGIYRDRLTLPIALTTATTLQPFAPRSANNAWLATLNRAEANLKHLSDYIEQVYPGAVQIYADLPLSLGKTMLGEAYQPGVFVLVSIFLFLGVGVLTIALMTFLERRKEIATLKAIGITNWQTVILFGFEYSLSGIMGFALTLSAAAILQAQASWFHEMTTAQLNGMLFQGVLIAFFVLCLALVYPIAIAKAASVDQLQFARTIPLRVTRLDHLENPNGSLTLKEQEENVRILKIPFEMDHYTCMLFKKVGDPVKRGEVVASEELYQGHVINNFISPCDGVIHELTGSLLAIAPDDPNEPFYPYPPLLAEEYKRAMAMVEQGRQRAREKRNEDEKK